MTRLRKLLADAKGEKNRGKLTKKRFEMVYKNQLLAYIELSGMVGGSLWEPYYLLRLGLK
jgi:hypothetical protein